MARREQVSNSCDPFMCKDEEGKEGKEDEVVAVIEVTREEATALVFAAALLFHIAENPSVFPADMVAGANKHKAAALTAAHKFKEIANDFESEAVREVVRRLNLAPGGDQPHI